MTRSAALPGLFGARSSPDGPLPSWLDWLSDWVALPLDECWTQAKRRHAVALAFALQGRRGTVAALRQFAELYAGARILVDEPAQHVGVWSLGGEFEPGLGFGTTLAARPAQGAVLGTTAELGGSNLRAEGAAAVPLLEDVAHRLCVRAYAADLPSPEAVARLRTLLDQEVPAHTVYHLGLIGPSFRVGVQATVGVDAIVAGAVARRRARARRPHSTTERFYPMDRSNCSLQGGRCQESKCRHVLQPRSQTMPEAHYCDEQALRQLTTPERNRYFFGKLLDAEHLHMEQAYGNRKRRLLNRLTLGYGVVCGLGVTALSDGKHAGFVGPGVAIDGLGREIIVPCASPPIDPHQPTDDCGHPAGKPIQRNQDVWLCLAYHECEAEPAPVLAPHCEGAHDCEPGVVRERYRVLVHTTAPPAINLTCGFPGLFGPPDAAGNNPDIHGILAARLSQTCTAPTGSPCVVLARVSLTDGKPPAIDLSPRPLVVGNQLLLELLVCLADRVEECCQAHADAAKMILYVSGDNQLAPAGQAVAAPLVVRVLQGGAPVANEQVTFTTVAAGEVTAAAAPATSVTAQTDASGQASVPNWRLGSATGPQQVTAAIGAGAPATVEFHLTATQPRR